MTIPPISSGSAVKTRGLAVAGIVCAVPKREISNSEFVGRFGEKTVNSIAEMTGVAARRFSPAEQTTVDLCHAAGERLLANLNWSRDSVDALIFVSQTPDYNLPASACVLQNRLSLHTKCAAFDISLGCSAYPYGLWIASKLLDGVGIKRILMMVGDTNSKLVNPLDRGTAMLFGDAGSATAIEYSSEANDVFFVLGSDGAGDKNLIVSHGAFRNPVKAGDCEDGAKRCIAMNGTEVFGFTLARVPALVKDLLEISGKSHENIDAFLFHQANSFILRNVIRKAGIPPEKVPSNIDRFGNTTCASIPLLIADRLKEASIRKVSVLLVGFGTGYSWSGAVLDIGPLPVNDVIEI